MKRVIICLLVGLVLLGLGIPAYCECESIVTKDRNPKYFCGVCCDNDTGIKGIVFENRKYTCDNCGVSVRNEEDNRVIFTTTVHTQKETERYTTCWKIATYSCIGGAVLVLFGVYDGLRCLVDRIRYGKEEE